MYTFSIYLIINHHFVCLCVCVWPATAGRVTGQAQGGVPTYAGAAAACGEVPPPHHPRS